MSKIIDIETGKPYVEPPEKEKIEFELILEQKRRPLIIHIEENDNDESEEGDC